MADEEVGGRITNEEPWLGVPHTLVFDLELSDGALRLWLALRKYGDPDGRSCFPSIGRLADELGLQRRAIERRLTELESAGLVDRLARYRSDGGRTSNDYFVRVRRREGASQMTHPDAASDDAPPSVVDDAPIPPSDLDLEPKQPRKNARAATRAAIARFSEFWLVYPRRIARPNAERAWAKAVTRADAELIIEGAKRHALDPNREDAFTKHPATWLNNDGWNDDPLPSRSTTTASTKQPNRGITSDRDTPSGRVYL